MTEMEELQKMEEDLKKLESGYGSPDPPKKEVIYKFFKEILSSRDSTKTANLSGNELGIAKIGVRHLQEIANYAEAEQLPMVADYLRDKAEIILSTSMSKKGFWSQLLVTQIKRESKAKDVEAVKKKKWWGGKTKEEGE